LSEAIHKIDQYIREEEAEFNDDCSALDNLRMWRVSTALHEKYIDVLAAENADLKYRLMEIRSLIRPMLTSCPEILRYASETEEA
jgi:hypothetical protein